MIFGPLAGRIINFYPRSPRGERRLREAVNEALTEFLSTLPARGATPRVGAGGQRPNNHFYPRSPRGERRGGDAEGVVGKVISIHAPREGSDFMGVAGIKRYQLFLSTLPARGATQVWRAVWPCGYISIHAPREGSDNIQPQETGVVQRISIHAPREGSDVTST